MPDFTEVDDWIILQPNNDNIPYAFTITVCSSAIANDGSIPYGDTVASCVVTAHKDDDTDATSELINTDDISGNIVIVNLKYPTSLGEGIYHLTFVVTTTNGSDIEFDFNRVVARDK